MTRALPHRLTFLRLGAVLLLAEFLLAQGAVPARLGHSCSLQTEDGVLWGIGPDYKVRFLEDGVEFTPALGARAPRNLPLRFRMLAVGRRGTGARLDVSPAVSPARTAEGLRVRYRRGTVSEDYELRVEGVEQSFVFDVLPEGEGDLVVLGRIETELPAQARAAGAAELRLESPGIGGVRIGAVAGIDADGRRAAGTLALDGGMLELALPAAFVDTASLPLVLDPLIGTTLTIGSGGDDEAPDVSVMQNNGLAVWSRRFSNGDLDLRGQRLQTNGTLLGSVFSIRANTTLISETPRVAAVPARTRWVVVWREGTGTNPRYIAACTVDGNGVVGPALQVVAGADDYANPDVGGPNYTLPSTEAIAVWGNTTQARIEGARLVVAANGTLSSLGLRILSPAGSHALPSIAQDGGVDGRFLIAWQTSTYVSGAIVNSILTVLTRPTLTSTSGARKSLPDVGGDGRHWVLGYDSRTDLLTPAELYCRWVTFDPGTGAAYLGPETLVAGGTYNQNGAAVAWLTNSVLVGYRDNSATNGGTSGAFVRSLDWFSCGPCEGPMTLDAASALRDVRRVAASGVVSEGLLVWETIDPGTGAGQIRARAFQADTGIAGGVENTACGPDVQVYASCARSGHAGFHLRLEHAEPGRPVFVQLGPFSPGGTFPCGSCRIIDPFRAFFFPAGVSDAQGNVAVPLPLPNAPGARLSFQFGILPSGAPGCPGLGLSFSRFGWFALP